jgi:hypothetical protein
MTRIVKMKVKCNTCGTTYAGLNMLSYNSALGGPKLEPLKCPKCANPWTLEQKVGSESIIGNPDAMKGYDQNSNTFPDEMEAPTSETDNTDAWKQSVEQPLGPNNQGEPFLKNQEPQSSPIDDLLANCGGGKYKDGIYLDQALAGNHEAATKKLQELEASGKRAKGTGSISGFVTHEFGHLMINDLRTNYPDIFANTVEPVLKKYAFQGQDWLEQNISTLASGKPKLNIKTDEILAEAFAESKLAKEPREAARELGAAIDTAYNQARPKDVPSSDTASNARLDHVKLLTDENTMAANLASSQLSQYIKEVTNSIAAVTQAANTKFQLMLQFELSPSEPPKLELANKGEVDNEVLQQVHDRVVAIQAPKPSSQAVVFQAEFSIN